MGGLGLIFFMVGGGIVLYTFRKEQNEEYLEENGVPITADLQGMELNQSFEVNGRHPFYLIAQWQNPSTS